MSNLGSPRLDRAAPEVVATAGVGVSVRIEHISKLYETRDEPVHAVDDVSLECKPGEFVAILGPSGCGKSTIFLMVAGLVPLSHGTITIGGTTVSKPYTQLGVVFQDAVLLDWRKVMGNVLLQAEMRGLDKRAYRSRAQDLLDLVGLTGFEGAATRSSSPAACVSGSRSAAPSSTTRHSS